MMELMCPQVLLLNFVCFTIEGNLQPINRGTVKDGSEKGEPSKAGSSKRGPSKPEDSQEEPGPSKKQKIACSECGECIPDNCLCWGKHFSTSTHFGP